MCGMSSAPRGSESSETSPESPVIVYVITSGDYSDYTIDSIWTTREAAEREAGGWGDIEEYVLNDRVASPIIQWRARVDGYTGAIIVDEKPQWQQEVKRTKIWPATTAYPRKSINGFLGEGYGPSPEHARKSLADAIAKAASEVAEL